MNTAEIEGMSIAERLQVMEAIWTPLLKSDSYLESPDWHQDVLVERHQQIDETSAAFTLDQTTVRNAMPRHLR